MTKEEARALIGALVMTRDAQPKMIKGVSWHGPYKLLAVTDAGLAILDGRSQYRIALNDIKPYGAVLNSLGIKQNKGDKLND